MATLKQISTYVEQSAKIIGGVLELDVLIVDSDLRIIGDSDLESVSQNECIRKDSLLARVMDANQLIIFSSKHENEGCSNCTQRAQCIVEMMIGIPIIYEEKVLGSLGIIANTIKDKEKMIRNQEHYLRFIERMIELIINRIDQVKKFEDISLLKKRMEAVLDSSDQYLMLVSGKGEILQMNLRLKAFVQSKRMENISDFLDEAVVAQILKHQEEIRYREVKLFKKFDFILSSKPISLDDKDQGVVVTLRALKDVAIEMNELYAHSMDVVFEDLVGESPQIKEVKERIKQIASSSSTVLIEGETGTGKEVIARLIHNTSKRCNEPFVAINCSAIPEDLMESELFGYEEGAFSGAKKGGKIGKFQLADGGTIFLDEIGEMAIHLQSKLLRVLQERQVTKIGGLESTDVDVRIIAATNRDLEQWVKKGRFREDLYYRLKVIPITSPPLRERKGDIKLLIDYFIAYYAQRIGKEIKGFSSDALDILTAYPWKGNVRELRNVIEFAVNMTLTDVITINALPLDVKSPKLALVEDLNLDMMMKNAIQLALQKYGETTLGKEMAAKALGISVATLYRKMKEFGI